MRGGTIAAWLALAGAVPSQGDSRPTPADYTTEGMTRRAAELLPLVEEEFGSKAGAPVVVRASSPTEIGGVLLEEAVLFRERMRTTARGPLLRSILKQDTAVLGGLVFAKVEASTGVVYVVPANIKERAEHRELGARVLGRPFLDAILIHELVHVLQHRRDPLPAFFDAPTSPDELLCRNTAVEGIADWISRRVHRRLGLEPEFEFVRRAQGTFPEAVVATSARRELAFLRAFQISPYIEGERFVDAVVSRLGPAGALERILASPPRSRSEIADPDAYAKDGSVVIDEEAVSEALRLAIASPPWERESVGLPEDALRADLADAGAEAVDAAVAEVVGGAFVAGKESLRAADPNNVLTVTVLFARSAEGAKKIFDAHVAAETAQTEQYRAGRTPAALISAETVVVAPPPAGADACVRMSCTLKPERAKPFVSSKLFARRGAVFAAAALSSSSWGPERLQDLSAKALEIASSRPVRGTASRRASPPDGRPTTKVRGTVRWKKEDGGPATGVVRIWTGPPGRAVIEAPMRDGAFEADVPLVDDARLGSVFADGDRFEDVVGAKLKLDAEGRAEILLPKPDVFFVRVVDEATGEPLRGVVAHPGRAWRRIPIDDPGFEFVDAAALDPTEAIRGDADGALRLPRDRDTWWIVADGSAATSMEPPSKRDAETPKTVRLGQGGGLRVRVLRPESLGGVSLSLRRADPSGSEGLRGFREHELTLGEDGVAEAVGLPKGDYVVKLLRGRRWDGALVAKSDAAVAQGTITEVVLDPPTDPDDVNVRLIFAAPHGGGWSGSYDVRLAPVGGKNDGLRESVSFGPAHLVADAAFNAIRPGSYEVFIKSVHFRAPITVTRGVDVHEVALPPLVAVVLKAIDAETGAAAAGFHRKSRQAPVDDEVSTGDLYGSASSAGVERFKVVPGRVEIEVSQPDYVPAVVTLDVRTPGPVETTVALKAAGRLRVRVEAPKNARVFSKRIRAVRQGEETPKTSLLSNDGSGDGTATFEALEPGRWTVRIDRLDQTKWKAAPAEADVAPRKTAEVVLKIEAREP